MQNVAARHRTACHEASTSTSTTFTSTSTFTTAAAASFFRGLGQKESFSQLVAGLYFVYDAMETEFAATAVSAEDAPQVRPTGTPAGRSSALVATARATVAPPSLLAAAEPADDARTATELLLDEIAAATQSSTSINTGGGIMLLREAGALTRRIFKQVWERICENGVAFLVHAVGSPLNASVATDAVCV